MLYVAREELPLRQYAKEIELQVENGCKITPGYNNINGCKSMINMMGKEINRSQIQDLHPDGEAHFVSWMIDCSTAAKKYSHSRFYKYSFLVSELLMHRVGGGGGVGKS